MKTIVSVLLAGAVATALVSAAPAKLPEGVTEVSQPASDAHRIEVSVTPDAIDLPKSVDGGKAAFVVKNTSNEALTVEVHAQELKRRLLLSLQAQATRIFQLQLRPGVYQVSCTIKNQQSKQVSVNLSVR